MHTPQEVIAAIQRGDFDGVLVRLKAVHFRAGDLVVFNSKVRPHYLMGIGAEIVQVNQVSAYCRITDDRAGKYRGSRIRVPLALIDAPSHVVANNGGGG